MRYVSSYLFFFNGPYELVPDTASVQFMDLNAAHINAFYHQTVKTAFI